MLLQAMIYISFDIIFFFQAEDGIRDGHVTGVQTCALPIFRAGFVPGILTGPRRRVRAGALLRVRTLLRVGALPRPGHEIGRASCRERVWVAVDGAGLKKKQGNRGRSEGWDERAAGATRDAR